MAGAWASRAPHAESLAKRRNQPHAGAQEPSIASVRGSPIIQFGPAHA